MVSSAWTFGRSFFAISILKIIRALCMVEKPEPYFYCPNGRSRRSDPSYEYYEHPKLDGRFHPFRKQKNAIYDRLSVTCTLGIRHHCHADISNPFCHSITYSEKICLASAKSQGAKIISALSKGYWYYQKHSDIQYRLFKISYHCWMFKTVYLSSYPSYIR